MEQDRARQHGRGLRFRPLPMPMITPLRMSAQKCFSMFGNAHML